MNEPKIKLKQQSLAAPSAAAAGYTEIVADDTGLTISSVDENGSLSQYRDITIDIFASRPAPGKQNRFFYSTDTKRIYRDTGSVWDEIEADPAAHALGGADHSADTLAHLNDKISDATLDDASDTRDPTSHASSHNSGGADELDIDAAAGTGSLRTLGTGATQACPGNDSRLSDARTPTAHNTTHQSGGSDAIKLDDLSAPDDTTDLDASTSKHGLLPKLGGGSTNFLRADGTWAQPPGTTALTFDEPASDHTAGSASIQDTGTVGEAVSFGDILYLKTDGKWWKADADTMTTMPGMRLALEAKSADQTCTMLVAGRVRDDSWAFTTGSSLYVSTTAGGLTHTAPSGTTDVVQFAAIPYAATKILFCPSPVCVEIA